MSGQILTEEELNAVGIMVGGLLNEGNINLGQSSMIESVFLSHDAQTEYIEAQDKAAQVWMVENERLKGLCRKSASFINIMLSFTGSNLEVQGWHQNGDTEPFDNFVNNNLDSELVDQLKTVVMEVPS